MKRFKGQGLEGLNRAPKPRQDSRRFKSTVQSLWLDEEDYEDDDNAKENPSTNEGPVSKTSLPNPNDLTDSGVNSCSRTQSNVDSSDNMRPSVVRRAVVTIRNNQQEFKGDRGKQRDLLNVKHKSLFVNSDNYEGAEAYDDLNNPTIKLKTKTTSDYLLNSETLYRNEIRKSIRNIMHHRTTPTPVNHYGVTLPIFNQASSYRPIMEYREAGSTPDSLFYSNATKQRLGQLTATHPHVFDSTSNMSHIHLSGKSNRLPAIASVMSSSCTEASRPPSVMTSAHHNINRTVVYLERPTNPSNEYESRV